MSEKKWTDFSQTAGRTSFFRAESNGSRNQKDGSDICGTCAAWATGLGGAAVGATSTLGRGCEKLAAATQIPGGAHLRGCRNEEWQKRDWT